MKTLSVLMLFHCWVVSLLAQENEAEKLFRAMEKKIISSAACEIKFEQTLNNRRIKGTILMAGEKQFRLTMSGLEGVPLGSLVVVGDGTRVSMSTAKTNWQTQCNLRSWVGYPLSRTGTYAALQMIPETQGQNEQLRPDDKDSKIQVYHFKLAGEEKIGSINTTRIEYKVGSRRGGQDDNLVTLWINSATQLPVQRLIKGSKLEPDLVIQESYQCRLDPKMDAKLFEIPKGK